MFSLFLLYIRFKYIINNVLQSSKETLIVNLSFMLQNIYFFLKKNDRN